MAIQISSTTVIDNSRNLTNITNATASSVASTFVLRDSTGVICTRSPVPGGTIICKASSVAWIVAPRGTEVSRTWYLRGDANTRAQAVTGCTGWFVPTCGQLQNPGYTCRTFWDSFSSTRYWSSTEFNATGAWVVCFDIGVITNPNKSNTSCVRAFRCVSY